MEYMSLSKVSAEYLSWPKRTLKRFIKKNMALTSS